MDFVVEKGKMTALVGPSGTGKSTVFKLLCRFYEHQSGDILLFGKEIKDWNVHSLRKYLSLVSQETYLYPTTIEENIAFGKPGASIEEVINAAKLANAHEFIMDFPEGYSTMVGERGVRLSGGQKQRIAIARAILKDAPILLLDEPTSALDNQAEAIVQETLNTLMKGRTVLAVAHRLSTIKDADIILVMDEGRIVESGSHEELFNKGGLYRQLYLKQMTLQEAQ
jgi:ABC-type multidrug transport system fused ATPase/permease subunit